MLTPAAGARLLTLAAALQDTTIVKQVEQPRDWFNTVSGIASILISLALLALCIGLIPAAWNFRKSYKKVNELLDKVYGDVNPLMRHASTIADNLNYVTTSIRVDVQQVNQTIAIANERLQAAVRETERRVSEFNALLHVVQEEAEGAFVATASTLHGVREGAATFRDDALGRSRVGAAPSGETRRRRAALRRADLEARLEARLAADEDALDYDDLEDLDDFDDLDDLDDLDELDDPDDLGEPEHATDELDADLGDEMDEVLLDEERAAAPPRGDLNAPPESGETTDGHSGRVPPRSGGRERPRIRSRRGNAPRDPGHPDA